MLKKIIIGILFIFIVLMAGLVASTFIFKDEINSLLKAELNKEVNAQIDYDDFDLSIFSTFPDFKFSLENLSVLGQGSFEGDTLASIGNLALNLDAKNLILEKQLSIHSVFINKLNLNAYVLADSSSSLNILKEDLNEEAKIDTSTESVIDIAIESFELKNARMLYIDALSQQVIKLKDLNLNAKVDYFNEEAEINAQSDIAGIFYENLESKQNANLENIKIDILANYLNDVLNLKTNSQFGSTSFYMDNTKLLNKALVTIEGTTKADLNKNRYDFNQILGVNNLKLNFDGYLENNTDNIALDIDFASNKSTFKELISLVPSNYLKEYEDVEVSGDFDLKGSVSGIYNDKNYPAFDIDFLVENGHLKYPDLPTSIDDIHLKTNIKNTSKNLQDLSLSMPGSKFTLAEDPIQFSLVLTNMVLDPFVDLQMNGNLDLEKVNDLVAIEDVKKLSGIINTDLFFKGKLSDVEDKNFNQIDFQGDMKMKDIYYESAATDLPLMVKTMDLNFNPKYASLSNFDMKYGKSDIRAKGKLENLINYVLADGTLKGNLDLESNTVDLTELMTEEETTSTSSQANENTEEALIKVPKNIDFVSNANIKTLKYDNIDLTNFKGGLSVKDETVHVNDIYANLLGGSAKINGAYSTKNEGKPLIDFEYDIKNFDIKQSFEYVNTVQAIAPIAKFLDGKFSSAFGFKTLLNKDYTPDLSLLTGLGDVKIPYASFLNFPMFQSVSETLKVPVFKDLDKASIKNAWTVFKINDGKVDVEPFDYEYKDMKMTLYGSNGFDKTIDYTMKLTIPSDKFGGAASVANNWLSKQNIPLLNLAVPKEITFDLGLSGLISNPKVKIKKVSANNSDKGLVNQLGTSIGNKAKEEADKLKKEAIGKAKEEADKLKKEALRKAKEEADRLKKEAAEKAKKSAGKLLKEGLKDKFPKFGF